MSVTEKWGKADLHIHSNHSDGLAKIPEIMEYVQNQTDLDVIAITDHNTIEGALFAKSLEELYDFEVIVGEEISSASGHIIGLYLTEHVRPGLSVIDTIAEINDQGGIAIIPHPFSQRGIFGPLGQSTFLNTANEFAFQALEVCNSIPHLGWANRMAAKVFNGGQGIAATGGSDAHVLRGIGTGFTRFRGTSAQALKKSIEALETTAESAPGGIGVALQYTKSIRKIRKQQAWNWERCHDR